MNERKPLLAKIYRWIATEDGGSKRILYDAFVIPAEGGMSSPVGYDEEFEIYVEEIE